MPTSSIDMFPERSWVSFVVPAHNEEMLIQGALDSVNAQTLQGRVDVIVAENGSDDDTAGRVIRYAADTTLPVRLLRDSTPGSARARNHGAAAARGEVLIFLDADSRAAPDLAERVMDKVRAGYPAGCIRMVADSADLLDRWFFITLELGKRMLGIRANMFYCTRAAFLSTGWLREELNVAEDLEFLQRLNRSGIPVAYLDGTWIATSPRRLRSGPLRLGMVRMLIRWALAQHGLGRRWKY